MRTAQCLAALLALVAVAVADDDKPVQQTKLPKSVQQAIKARYSKAEFVKAFRHTDTGEILYHVTLKSDNQNLVVTFTSRGKVTEISRKVEIKDLPKVMVLTLRKQYPGAKLEEARLRGK